MCGRYTLDTTPEELVEHFDLDKPPAITPRFNIAPSQLVAVVASRKEGEKRGLASLKWGFVPEFANDTKFAPINARAETVGGLGTFSESFRNRRRLIPSTGLYKWTGTGKKKQPH